MLYDSKHKKKPPYQKWRKRTIVQFIVHNIFFLLFLHAVQEARLQTRYTMQCWSYYIEDYRQDHQSF